MRLISAGSLVRAQSGPFFILDFLLARHTSCQPESSRWPRSEPEVFISLPKTMTAIYSGPVNNSIPSAALSLAIFLNAAATFAGNWTDVPGGGGKLQLPSWRGSGLSKRCLGSGRLWPKRFPSADRALGWDQLVSGERGDRGTWKPTLGSCSAVIDGHLGGWTEWNATDLGGTLERPAMGRGS